jgi:hypothetical protein
MHKKSQIPTVYSTRKVALENITQHFLQIFMLMLFLVSQRNLVTDQSIRGRERSPRPISSHFYPPAFQPSF